MSPGVDDAALEKDTPEDLSAQLQVPDPTVQPEQQNPRILEYVDDVINTTSPEQAAMIEDYTVTLEEYESASRRYAQCLNNVGLQAEVLPGAGLRPVYVAIGIPDDDGTPDATTVGDGNAAVDTCMNAHIGDVALVWAYQRSELEADPDAVEALYARVEQCMAEGRGYRDAPRWLTPILYPAPRPMELPANWQDHYAGCAAEAYEATGMRPPMAVNAEQFACRERNKDDKNGAFFCIGDPSHDLNE